MFHINAIERVLDKRHKRGASDKNLIAWLNHLKQTSCKKYPKTIDGFIDAIIATPAPQSKRSEQLDHWAEQTYLHDDILVEIINEFKPSDFLDLPGFYEAVSEEFSNEIVKRMKRKTSNQIY